MWSDRVSLLFAGIVNCCSPRPLAFLLLTSLLVFFW